MMSLIGLPIAREVLAAQYDWPQHGPLSISRPPRLIGAKERTGSCPGGNGNRARLADLD